MTGKIKKIITIFVLIIFIVATFGISLLYFLNSPSAGGQDNATIDSQEIIIDTTQNSNDETADIATGNLNINVDEITNLSGANN